MAQLLIIGVVFLGVAALVGAVASVFASRSASETEIRLDLLTSTAGGALHRAEANSVGLMNDSGLGAKNFVDQALSRYLDLPRLLSQANVKMSSSQFVAATVTLLVVGTVGWCLTPLPKAFAPFVGLILAALPSGYVWWKRKKRANAFAQQLPDALDLISRALRAGHSLAAGFSLVGEEMSEPIRSEFARCYEEQNLGIPLDQALEGMTERVPNLDLRFFATAVVLQRTTGGDLAEILDKIGHLIRERFRIWGQIQALTGEGRLSGIVLLALPPVLFVVMYRLNSEYLMVLFTDSIGRWLLSIALIMQLLGALVIRKIVNIQV